MGKKNDVSYAYRLGQIALIIPHPMMLALMVPGAMLLTAPVWKYQQSPVFATGGWTMQRGFNMQSISSKITSEYGSWGTLQQEMCEVADEYVSSMNSLGGFLGDFMASKANDQSNQDSMSESAEGVSGATGGLVGAGDAVALLLGCKQWPNCRTHAMARCTTYKKVKLGMQLALGFFAIGFFAALGAVANMSQEKNANKKAKKAIDGRWWSAALGCCSFIMPLFGLGLFMFFAVPQINQIRKSAVFPHDSADAGLNFVFGGSAISFLAAGWLQYRYHQACALAREQKAAKSGDDDL